MSLAAAFGIATGDPTVWPVGSYAVTTPAWLSATVSGPCWAASNVIPQALRRWGSVWAAIPGVSATRLTCAYPRAAAGGALTAPHPTAASPTTAARPGPRIRALVAMPDLLNWREPVHPIVVAGRAVVTAMARRHRMGPDPASRHPSGRLT